MQYAKIVDGKIQFAPNPVNINGAFIGNPPASVYEDAGYKPVTFTNPPREVPDGHYWKETWTESNGTLLQEWVLTEAPDDVTAEEAMQILFNGGGG